MPLHGAWRACQKAAVLGALCLAAPSLLSGCTSIKQAIGMEKVSPDEFAIVQRAPLTMPPNYDLRPPQPGAPRPQEQSTAEQARGIFDRAGPGAPGTGSLSRPASGSGDTRLAAVPAAQTAPPLGDLSNKLLSAQDSAASGTVVDKRETTVTKGVY